MQKETEGKKVNWIQSNKKWKIQEKKRIGSDGKKVEEVRKNLMETNMETEDWTRCEERQKRMRGSS